ncbi:MAG TPA: FtsX-like permease family protein [bacterium]|nr:FtsX-like permease family protein [bacterium]
MNIIEPIFIGIAQLRANKLRSILSLIGILIAVGSVTGIVSIGEGLQDAITKEFEQMGGFTTIWSWAPNPWYRNKSGRWVRRNWEEHLTFRDIDAIKAETDKVEFIVPQRLENGWDVKYRSASFESIIQFGTTEMIIIENMKIAKGRFLNMIDLINSAKVCVLGSDVSENLFGTETDPIDKEIKIRGMRYTVVGVMEPKEFFDNNYNQRIMAPITTAQKRIYGNDYFSWISIKVNNAENVQEVVEAIKRVYRRIHRHGDEFGIRTGEEALNEINKIILIMKAVAGGIAGISLLVGGIGIMNIMLVSVTERTREIGIRKSLGATRSSILWQFLVESVILCLFGGILGICLGLLIGYGIAAYITNLTKMTFHSVISSEMMMFTVGFSLFVGITFGVYPAWRASRLDPVEALSHE